MWNEVGEDFYTDFLRNLNSDVFQPTVVTDKKIVKQKKQEEEELQVMLVYSRQEGGSEARDNQAWYYCEEGLRKKNRVCLHDKNCAAMRSGQWSRKVYYSVMKYSVV